MIFPLLLLVGLGAWHWYQNQTPGVMTAERKAVYLTVMRFERDPAKIKYWADWFAKEGFTSQARNLRNRIQVPQITGERRNHRSDIVKRALTSNNASAIMDVAEEFEKQGHGATAGFLHEYAQGMALADSLDDEGEYQ